MQADKIRNVAIIAHVDHGKTTLVDGLLKQSHTFRANQAEMGETLIMDSGDQERERGITITAKTTAVKWNDYKINIVDTPGHADFSGEVERTLNLADGVLLIVDAAEGPMPQTKFVLSKALQLGLKPIVVINKIDKPARRIREVLDEVENLFLELATDDAQLKYPVYYAVARDGKAWDKMPDNIEEAADLSPLFDAIVREIPAPKVAAGALQILVTSLEYDNFVGKYAVGKIHRGTARKNQAVKLLRDVASENLNQSRENSNQSSAENNDNHPELVSESNVENPEAVEQISGKIDNIFVFQGLGKVQVGEAAAGEIVALTGLADARIGDTIADADHPDKLPGISVEAPTLSMYLGSNTSPLKGKEGEFTTSRQLGERLRKELETNVALKVQSDGIGFQISGRGELHLSVLIEAMRREGYEFEVGRPRVVLKKSDGKTLEPVEDVQIEVGREFVGAVSQSLGSRHAELKSQVATSQGAIRFDYRMPTRALIGLRNELLTASKGTAIINSLPAGYQPLGQALNKSRGGALIASESGQTTAFALANAEARGQLFLAPGIEVYAGQIVGLNARAEDLEINVCKGKHLTNMRSKSSDGAVQLTPPTRLSLEQSIDFIENDELLEVTPRNLRLRKKYLDSIERKKHSRRDS
ncbi:MAG: GTP-binding protein [Candidatus Nomurabacteria bacterium]|jgi:GTP-binding protein|nr:GTP-binding protein [Candidatus Nomurabacteria bacterium]